MESHLAATVALLHRIDGPAVARLAALLAEAARDDVCVFTLGNGGSAAHALHFAADLTLLAQRGGPVIRASALAGNPSVLTACANDFGYNDVFVVQLRALLRPRDIVIALSTSGTSPNCVRAAAWARAHGATVASLVGSVDCPLARESDLVVAAPGADALLIETAHLAVLHAVSAALRVR